MDDQALGKVTIAPTVLTTIVRLTALEHAGVHRLAPLPSHLRGLLSGGTIEEGIFVEVTDEGVKVELHVVAEADTNILKLGETLQSNIRRAIEEMVGMDVAAVDVHIDNIILPPKKRGSKRAEG